MTRGKKQLLGAVGLAFVAALTAIAAGLPTPDARAEEWTGDVTVKVTVESDVPPAVRPTTVTIDEPTDLSVWLWGNGGVPVKTSYTRSNLLIYQLTCYHDDQIVFENEEIARKTVSGSGTDTFTLTDEMVLDAVAKAKELEGLAMANAIRLAAQVTTTEYLNYDFRLSVVSYGANGSTASDAARFMYREIVTNVIEATDEKGDPMAEIDASKNVHKLILQVYDPATGKPVFVKEDGTEEPIVVTRSELESGDFKVKVTLLMAKYGAKAGTYDLVTVAYGADGKTLSINTNTFEYKPGVDVPNTGSIFGNLNISKVDYAITGVVVFGAAAMFAIYMIVKKSKR